MKFTNKIILHECRWAHLRVIKGIKTWISLVLLTLFSVVSYFYVNLKLLLHFLSKIIILFTDQEKDFKICMDFYSVQEKVIQYAWTFFSTKGLDILFVIIKKFEKIFYLYKEWKHLGLHVWFWNKSWRTIYGQFITWNC